MVAFAGGLACGDHWQRWSSNPHAFAAVRTAARTAICAGRTLGRPSRFPCPAPAPDRPAPFPNAFALELGNRAQHVELQRPAGGGVDALGRLTNARSACSSSAAGSVPQVAANLSAATDQHVELPPFRGLDEFIKRGPLVLAAADASITNSTAVIPRRHVAAARKLVFGSDRRSNRRDSRAHELTIFKL